MGKLILIDADLIVYSVGYAAKDDPVENALHSVKKMIHSILDACESDEYECFLTGKDNYRNDIATIKPYKGNRTQDKPIHYQAIRDYLINVHGAVVINGMESDDQLGIQQSDDTIIASLDKDLDMIEGEHYNWRRGELYYVDKESALKNFYRQLLTGDSTDNIVGIPGVGPVKANAILEAMEEVEDFYEEPTEEDWYWRILDKYSEHYAKPYHALEETAHLIYIQDGSGRWKSKW